MNSSFFVRFSPIVCVALGLLTILTGCADPETFEKHDFSSVGFAFARALVNGDAEKARSLTSPELHPRLDNWLVRRPKFECPFSWDFDDNLLTGAGSGSEESGSADFSLWYYCGNYSLTVDDIKLEFSGESWIIKDWSELCEWAGGGSDEVCDQPK
jgi:hypothetical protein